MIVLKKFLTPMLIIRNLFLILICGLPWSIFLCRKWDLWHTQGMFFQLGILILFSASLFYPSNKATIKNKPLASLCLWLGLITCYYWFNLSIATGHYPIKVFLPYFNFLCFILFYKLSIDYLNRETIEKILKYFSYSILIMLGYCFMQLLNLDQFFRDASSIYFKDLIVGTIGNQGHLAGYLAILQPLFFKKNMRNILILTLLWLIILKTMSFAGVLTGLAVILFWLVINKRYRIAGILVIFLVIFSYIAYRFMPYFYCFSGRLEIWQDAFKYFHDKAILGNGLGFYGMLQIKFNDGVWRHLHQEYYQIAIEAGIIGLGIILWCIWEYFEEFRALKDNLTMRLATIFFGFCMLGLFSFPAHLWTLSAVGMMAYSWLFVIKSEVQN